MDSVSRRFLRSVIVKPQLLLDLYGIEDCYEWESEWDNKKEWIDIERGRSRLRAAIEDG